MELQKAYNPQEHEDRIYEKWEKSGFFNPDNLDLPAGAKTYCISMPPPNVTGTLHMGHAAMLALEDILVRFHRMSGYRTLWLPGTDHAAIATQTKVEKLIKEEGSDRHQLGRESFLQRVGLFAQDSHDTIVGQIKKMGSSCDWSREAFTLDETRTKVVRSVFKMMYEDGLIYRGERIVNWCPRCHSTLADDEVEYKEQKTLLYHFRYSRDFPITIATTRPETKLGDTAVAVNPKDKRYKALVGKTFEIDFVGVSLKIKIVADREVDMEFGTGALGVTPAHSAVDWKIAEENNLEVVKVIDEDGKIRQSFGEYSGMKAQDARKKVIDNLRSAGLLENEESIDNNISLCYRCDTAVEPLTSLQWFIDVNKKTKRLGGKTIKETCIQAVKSGVFGKKQINIIPKRFEKDYFHWIENLRDWCISRQIWYGHQVPVWHKKDRVYVGIEPPQEDGWTQEEDTLDTWFSSGMWTFSTLAGNPEQVKIINGKLEIDSPDFQNFHPTAVLETGYDILFFWVARMVIMTTYATEDIPFENVYLHGLVLDEHGKKMSKSKGNVINPLDMIKKYGTDATRLSLVIGSTPGTDLRLSEEKIAGFRNMINKLWNISRFILLSKSPNKNFSGLTYEDLALSDFWILEKMRVLVGRTTEDLSNFRFSQSGERIRAFLWEDFADWYIEVSKLESNKETKSLVLKKILADLLKLLHPFAPFVTETLWQKLEKNLLMTASWPKEMEYQKIAGGSENVAVQDFEKIKSVVSAIRNARAEYGVGPAKKLNVHIYANKDLGLIKKHEKIISNLRTGIDELKIEKSGKRHSRSFYASLGGIEVYVPLEGLIDLEKEQARLSKELRLIEGFQISLSNRLKNRKFLENAPAEVIEKNKQKISNNKKRIQKIKTFLANLE